MKTQKTGLWEDKKAKELFDFIEEQKQKNIPLIKAFDLFAEKTGRKQNSVRNYYYFQLKHFEKNPTEAKKTGVILNNHRKTIAKKFSDKEEKELIEKVDKLRSEGKSVRKACLLLANSNIAEMIRLQNKIRQLKKKNMGFNSTSVQQKNVVQMPIKKNIVSENEISSLFLGLVKMVQKNALHLAETKVVCEKQRMQSEINEAQKSVKNKENEIEALKREKSLLSIKSKELEKELFDFVNNNSKPTPIQKKSEARQEKLAKVIKNLEKKSNKTQNNA
ncbi:MAG: hypothetical protein WCR30_01565 [Clostridia bacterium]